MTYTITADDLHVSIHAHGAEVCSMKKAEKEYIWQADPQYWQAHGPLLFPIVGRTKNDMLNIGGKDCHIPTHGFLSNMTFDCLSHVQDEVVLCAQYNEETLEQYPFRFQVIASYRVKENALIGTYRLVNLDDKTMPYGFGLHNGFYCLEGEDDVIENVYLQFDHPISVAKPSRTKENLMDFANRIPVMQEETVLSFHRDWYPTEAPVMDDITFHSFDLCHKTRGVLLHYSFSDGFELFNAWQANGSPFLCLEPWSSQCGIHPPARTLEEVKNTKFLAVGQSKEYSFEVALI